MQRRSDVPRARLGLAALLVLLIVPGASIAGSVPDAAAAAPAPLLQEGAGYGAPAEGERVRALQRELRALGWRPGPVDGLFGPLTKRAVLGFQDATNIPVDGIAGPLTQRALRRASRLPLRRGSGYATPAGSPRVRRLQRRLQRAGLRPGPVDGRLGPLTEAAVIRLQRSRGLPASGVVDDRTHRALTRAADRQRTRPVVRPSVPKDEPATIQIARSEPAEEPVGEWLFFTAVVALALGALAGLMAGRPRTLPSAAPAVALARGVVAEGVARAGSIGRFRGQVHALVVGRWSRRRPDARYLISDPDKGVPFWVDHEEVTRFHNPAREPAASGRERQPATNGEETKPAPQPEQKALSAAPPADGVKALGYVSVQRNGSSDAIAMREQATAIDSVCEERGWRLVEVVHDVEEAGGATLKRPGLAYALGRMAKGDASCLVVSELSRLTHPAAELSRLLELVAQSGGRLVVLDVGLDTASDPGRIAANSLLRLGSWERKRTLEKTQKGLAAARAKRAVTGQLAVEDLPALKQRIVDMRSEGMTLQAIADRLNEDGVPTVRGGQKWRPSSVQAALGYRRPRRREAVREGGSERKW
jgi:peptidoglycan hydrolase-like protein with peptidoglycan-binding domain/DNA invertase Pin-like site-specific DNA recombinase